MLKKTHSFLTKWIWFSVEYIDTIQDVFSHEEMWPFMRPLSLKTEKPLCLKVCKDLKVYISRKVVLVSFEVCSRFWVDYLPYDYHYQLIH
jgi:hypothetical protein